jgi:electron transfer flavoprotein alpha subunit
MKEILVIAEYDKKDITDLTKEIVGVGKKFAQETGALLSAVIFGEEYHHLGEILASYGTDLVYLGKDQALNHYNSDIYLNTLMNLIEQKQPDVILCGMSVNGRELGSRLAARLKTVFISGVMSLEQNEMKELEAIRFKWGGRGQEKVTVKSPLPVILGLAPEVRGIETPRSTFDLTT